ncbi:MAG: Lrp/AsnC family transcriptional regulator [Candidatus Thermoplasmatota archaeon]|jgi:Lrp/AsnC family transcriptional regulator for asnA, asnC and gidA|uniref:Lrp/AsnC family transcriptional regulator n=1 Tax=Ferroplasma sp. TaxID=2591003 RepID=UPI002639A917|nr:Lrp/AsnC family transcriptional regulator [Ferroplasma sp.]MCL4311186.1 Lrp/AsnC family transcriptional regulator [Candidatus Thermoplasmatota archaeon]
MVDEFDKRILNIIKDDSAMPLKDIGNAIGLFSPSAVSKRIKDMKKSGIIKKEVAILDYERLGFDFMTIILIKTKYSKNYASSIGDKLKQLPNVIAIYFVLGDIDFIVFNINKDRSDFLKVMEALTEMEEIDRSDSRVVAYAIKDIDFGSIKIK